MAYRNTEPDIQSSLSNEKRLPPSPSEAHLKNTGKGRIAAVGLTKSLLDQHEAY